MIKVKKLYEDAIIPSYAHKGDTGFDLHTVVDTLIEPYSTAIAKTGLAFELPFGWGIQIRPRSGISVKGCPVVVFKCDMTRDGLHVSTDRINSDVQVIIGTVDNNYRGEIGIIVRNNTNNIIQIPKHTKLAQGVLEELNHLDFIEVEELNNTARGQEGFGSTGI